MGRVHQSIQREMSIQDKWCQALVKDQAVTTLFVLEEGAIGNMGIVHHRGMVTIVVIRPEVGFHCFHIACVWNFMSPDMFEVTQCSCVHLSDQIGQD